MRTAGGHSGKHTALCSSQEIICWVFDGYLFVLYNVTAVKKWENSCYSLIHSTTTMSPSSNVNARPRNLSLSFFSLSFLF